ncbi:MAG: hypothetical protein ACXABU_10570 [Candidatus Hodarchaeales archaeon]|jgi:hypothetical protein
MVEKKKRIIEKELRRIEVQLGSISGVRKRHTLLKRQNVLKKELKGIRGNIR